MKEIGINDQDIKEAFVRSSGKGGQHVNKVSTCVVLHHLPSGIIIKCQKSRSQGLNRYWARKLLLNKIHAKRSADLRAKVDLLEKERRKKRRRCESDKEIILMGKRMRSEKKSNRQSIKPHQMNEF